MLWFASVSGGLYRLDPFTAKPTAMVQSLLERRISKGWIMKCPSCSARIVDHEAISSLGSTRTCPVCALTIDPDVPRAGLRTHLAATLWDLPHARVGRSIEAPRFAAGEALADRYRIVDLLGRGSMGEVYSADDLKLLQRVALKFLPQAAAEDPFALAQFLDEVKIARQITHPNVCRVFDIGEAAGSHFISMEHIEGEDLASHLERHGRLPRAKALEIGRQLCAGLEAVHDRGILHLDLKPSNVLLDEAGRVRLTDFGMAAAAGEATQGGTPPYMAPELWQGQQGSVQTDLYALGLVLYEMLTGKQANRAGSLAEIARMHAEVTPVPPSNLVPDIDASVEQVILRCLEKTPDQRPPSARAVADRLAGRGGESERLSDPLIASGPPSIPRPKRDFTGRDRELAELRAQIGEHGGALIYGLRGLGGVGKTELALKLAEEVGAEYPDGHVLVELGGASDRPLAPADALAQAIRAFEPRTQLPDSVAQLRQIYQSVLEGRRVLLLLDDAASAEQVEPLLAHPGCLTIVTSRFRFALPRLHRQDLDALGEAAARELLLSLAPRLGTAAGELAQLLGRLPLALRLAGSAFAERPDLEAGEYIRKFLDRDERVELIEAAIGLNYSALDDELRRRWRALAVFPGGFNAGGAAAVWSIDESAAKEILGGGLLQVSLVDWSGGRYRLHALARDFAAARLGDDERRAAEGRHAGHYVEVLAEANRLYLKGGEKILEGLARFDREWANIRAGQAWAVAHAGDDPTAARHCCAFPTSGFSFLDLRLHPRDGIAWLEAGRSAATTLGNRQKEGHLLGNLGAVYALLGEPRQTIVYCQQQLTIAREIGDRRSESVALGNLGSAYLDLGEIRRALDFFEQHLAISRELGNRRNECAALGNLGLVYAALGETGRAIELHEQCVTISRDIGHRRGEGRALGNLGFPYLDLGEPRRAIEYFSRALEIIREIGDRRAESIVLGDLGRAYADLDKPRRAIEHHRQALEIDRKIGDRRGQGQDLGNLGLAYAALGEQRRAIRHLRQAVEIAREIGDRREEALGCWHLGLEVEKQGDLMQAARLMQLCVDFKRDIEHPEAKQDAARVDEIRARLAGDTGFAV